MVTQQQLALVEDKLNRVEEDKRQIELEKREQGVKTTQVIMDLQREAMEAREAGRCWEIRLEGMIAEL